MDVGAVSYTSYEELSTFAAAAAVTERIRLTTNVLVSPPRNTAVLAKQAATVDQISGGRLTLGLAVGWREADYTLAERDFGSRGSAFDRQLRDLRRAWAGGPDAGDASGLPGSGPEPDSDHRRRHVGSRGTPGGRAR